jgi:predicted NUDIX family NTP pyrophosphohydrolase
MPKKSAGLLLYRFKDGLTEVFLVHPGGPFWAKKDLGVWSIPKGEFDEAENPLQAAKRETEEETGIVIAVADENFIQLPPVKLKSGKIIFSWALEFDATIPEFKSNLFEMEWPPKSGKKASFVEVDKTAWFSIDEAKKKITAGQLSLIEELQEVLNK